MKPRTAALFIMLLHNSFFKMIVRTWIERTDFRSVTQPQEGSVTFMCAAPLPVITRNLTRAVDTTFTFGPPAHRQIFTFLIVHGVPLGIGDDRVGRLGHLTAKIRCGRHAACLE